MPGFDNTPSAMSRIFRFVTFTLLLCPSTVTTAQQTYYDVTAGNGYGLRFWSQDYYKIHMGNAAEYHFGPVNDYSIKMNMNNDPGRGWTWGIAGLTPVAAISIAGDMQIAGNFTALGYLRSGSGVISSNSGDHLGLMHGVRSDDNSYEWVGFYSGTTRQGIILYDGAWSVANGLTDEFSITAENGNKLTLNTSSDHIALMPGGTGNVGIGTTSPAEKLHLNGSVRGNISGALRISTGNGYVDVGPQNSAWSHFQTDRSKFYFNRPIYVDGGISSYNANNLVLQTGGTTRLTVNNSNGNVGIGTTSPDQKLTVNGNIHAKEVKVDLSVPGPDYVFDEDYQLTSLEELKSYIEKNKHLPEIPSAKEMEMNGINLMEMNLLLLKKVEELTLYLLEKDAEIRKLKEQMVALDHKMDQK